MDHSHVMDWHDSLSLHQTKMIQVLSIINQDQGSMHVSTGFDFANQLIWEDRSH